MVTGIEEARKRLSLTVEEETIIECDEEAADNKTEQISLCFWGKLHTEGYFNANAMKTVLKNFVGCDESSLLCAADKLVNLQVDVDITKPLQRGMHVLVDDESDLQYEDWLQGSLIKPTRCNIEALNQEEKRLFLTYHNGNASTMSTKKLTFDGTHDKSASSLTQGGDSPRLDDMVVDDAWLLQPGNEAFIRKLIDQGKAPSGEWKARLISDEEVSSEVSVPVEVARQPCQEP
ncbi:hypothetical protein Cgig2_004251 [Carnegiea gigantea]|uniref:Uncharacterized protein n=1 Tax=Carnegiea gigantea TaxID=171969 RepID=A0A9Q1KHP9_9CARY|nr:hypothetical protein Cgig2_004251 [Carnegiea gigantea]